MPVGGDKDQSDDFSGRLCGRRGAGFHSVAWMLLRFHGNSLTTRYGNPSSSIKQRVFEARETAHGGNAAVSALGIPAGIFCGSGVTHRDGISIVAKVAAPTRNHQNLGQERCHTARR